MDVAQPPVGTPSTSGFSLGRWLSSQRRLLMVAAVIVAVVILGVLQTAPRGFDPIEQGELIFPDLAAIELSAINLYDPATGTSMTLRRENDGRWIEETSGSEADPSFVNQLAQTIVRLSYRQATLLEADADLTAYGFAPGGRLFVEFIEADGTLHAVAIGDLLPDSEAGYYALVDDRPSLYVIPRGAADFLISQLQNTAIIRP
jgi:hypothetical protein